MEAVLWRCFAIATLNRIPKSFYFQVALYVHYFQTVKLYLQCSKTTQVVGWDCCGMYLITSKASGM